MTYDPIPYWQERGKTYEAAFRPDRYRDQERVLREVLRGLEFRTVLEVGCGFGRIARLVTAIRPSARYTGIDLSPEMLAAAQLAVPSGRFVESSLQGFRSDPFDLVIAVEVLMHVPPKDIGAAMRKLRRLGRQVVTVDWTTPLPKVAPHNFLHDYSPLGGTTRQVGLQTVRVA